jgi:kinesin family protein C2/C3
VEYIATQLPFQHGQVLLVSKVRKQPAALVCCLQVLEDIDAKYRRVVEDNRKLYNQVQDLRGNIRVFCR